jgi:hypothetical protein
LTVSTRSGSWCVGLGAALQGALLWPRADGVGLLLAAVLGLGSFVAWRAGGPQRRLLVASASLGGAGMLLGGLLDAAGAGPHVHGVAHWPPGFASGLMLLGCGAGCVLAGGCRRGSVIPLGPAAILSGFAGMLVGMEAARAALTTTLGAVPHGVSHLGMLAGMLAGMAGGPRAVALTSRAVTTLRPDRRPTGAREAA